MSLGTAVEIGEIGARLSEGRVDVGGRLKAPPGTSARCRPFNKGSCTAGLRQKYVVGKDGA